MEGNGKLSTEQLMQLLFQEQNLTDFFGKAGSSFQMPSFSEYINVLCDKRNEVVTHVIAKAGLSKSYGHKIINGTRRPSRDAVIQLAFALEADVSQLQQMLRIARQSELYPRVKRDATVIYCLHNRISMIELQSILKDMGLPVLGEDKRYE